jgi:amidase
MLSGVSSVVVRAELGLAHNDGRSLENAMRRFALRLVALMLSFVLPVAFAAAQPEATWAGSWRLTVNTPDGSTIAPLELKAERGELAGTSGALDENGFFDPLTVSGRHEGAGVVLRFFAKAQPVATLRLHRNGPRFTGDGQVYGVPASASAERTAKPEATATPQVFDFAPTTFHTQFSGRFPPVLRLRPGDSVRTTTLDNEGQDASLNWKGMPGNTLTGPFFVDGAMPGDTLVVHLKRVALSRDSAKMFSRALNPRADPAPQSPAPGWGRDWTIDRAKGEARLAAPGDRLSGLVLPVRPMVGSIGVAPPLGQSIFAGDLGPHGGNLDYNRLVTGATIYLPVFQPGALLFLGDGHALQGDGEVTGQGLETSLDIEFQIELIKGKSLGQLWFEDADDVMVSGVDNSLDLALQAATSGMSHWLHERYGLNDSEIASLLGAAIHYDIAEVVDPRPHVVARLSKAVLAKVAQR